MPWLEIGVGGGFLLVLACCGVVVYMLGKSQAEQDIMEGEKDAAEKALAQRRKSVASDSEYSRQLRDELRNQGDR